MSKRFILCLWACAQGFALSLNAAPRKHPLYEAAAEMASVEVSAARIDYYLGQAIDRYVDAWGRATPELQSVLFAIEDDFISKPGVNAAAVQEFQWLVAQVGGELHSPAVLPKDDHSLWMLYPEHPPGEELRRKLLKGQSDAEVRAQFPFGEYHSSADLPADADVVIIGAGLTGSIAAYNLSKQMPPGTKIVLLDSDLMQAASFRNGGNFEAMPESFLGDYEGLVKERVKYTRLTRPGLSETEIERFAEDQADWILKWCAGNVDQLYRIFDETGINAFTSKKWLRIAETETEERALQAEVERARKLGLPFEFYSADRIRSELKIETEFGGRMALKSGNYHPGRLVTQLLRHLLRRGVQLHTRTAVTGITQATGSDHWVETARGRIQAKKVLLATNGFTQEVRPELPIAPFQSQVVNFNHVALPSEDPAVFATWTWNLGDVYGHFRAETIYRDAEGQLRGTFLVGGGRDKTLENARSTERDVEAFHEILEKVAQKIPDIKNHPPVRYSRGTMGFPPDRIPLIGEIEPGLYSSAGFAGYGGSWLIQGAAEIASIIAGGHGSPLYQKRFLSPNRFRDGSVVNPLGRPFMNDDAEACARALQKRN